MTEIGMEVERGLAATIGKGCYPQYGIRASGGPIFSGTKTALFIGFLLFALNTCCAYYSRVRLSTQLFSYETRK